MDKDEAYLKKIITAYSISPVLAGMPLILLDKRPRIIMPVIRAR